MSSKVVEEQATMVKENQWKSSQRSNLNKSLQLQIGESAKKRVVEDVERIGNKPNIRPLYDEYYKCRGCTRTWKR